jgi:hypothetical protein
MIITHTRHDDSDDPIDEQRFIEQIEDMLGRDLFDHEIDFLGDLYDEVYDQGYQDASADATDP